MVFSWKHILRMMAARLRQRRFAHIIPIGLNCEVAFRLYRRWKGLDSSLFSWGHVRSLDTLTAALRRWDDIFRDDCSLNERILLWECERTGIRLHGKMKLRPGEPLPDAQTIAADKADLLGRVKHLKEKFIRQISDDEPTLFVHRIKKEDCAAPDLGEKLDALQQALRDLGANNAELLVVTEREDAGKVPPAPRRIVRSVARFNPGAQVTVPELGDTPGWNAIFTEFAPLTVSRKKHDFKFEAE